MAASISGSPYRAKGMCRTIRFEKVLVDVEAGAEGLEGGFQPLHRPFLFGVIQTLVIDSGDAKNDAGIAALR